MLGSQRTKEEVRTRGLHSLRAAIRPAWHPGENKAILCSRDLSNKAHVPKQNKERTRIVSIRMRRSAHTYTKSSDVTSLAILHKPALITNHSARSQRQLNSGAPKVGAHSDAAGTELSLHTHLLLTAPQQLCASLPPHHLVFFSAALRLAGTLRELSNTLLAAILPSCSLQNKSNDEQGTVKEGLLAAPSPSTRRALVLREPRRAHEQRVLQNSRTEVPWQNCTAGLGCVHTHTHRV